VPVDLVELLRKLSAAHGDFVRFPLGGRTHYSLNRPDHVRLLLVEHAHHLRKPAFMRDSNRGHWGDGLTTLEGEAWRGRRALLRPAFRGGTLARHLRIVASCTEDMLAALRPGQALDLEAELRLVTARIAARSLFDAEVEGFGTVAENERRAGVIPLREALGEDFATPVRLGDAPPLTLTRPRAPARMDATLAILDARLASGEDRGDMLSSLAAATAPDGSRLIRDEVVGEIVQMLYAGHLTIPATLSRLWLALSRFPAVAERNRAEAAQLPAELSASGEIAPEWFELVVKETMRFYPPAPILYREVDRPFAVDGHELEVDSAVWVCPQIIHHDPRHYPEPEVFRPERFASDRVAGIPEAAYLPFGLGPRTCIGNRLATAQMGVMTALTARRFQLVPWPGSPRIFEVVGPG
jgi:cytochrome P450